LDRDFVPEFQSGIWSLAPEAFAISPLYFVEQRPAATTGVDCRLAVCATANMPFGLRLLFWVSALSAAGCAAIHVLTFSGAAFSPMIFLVLLLFVALLFVVWPLVIWRWRRTPRRNFVSEVFGNIPRWMKYLAGALLVYAFANFFVCRALNDWGEPARLKDGRLVLQTKAGLVRELSPEEFRTAQAVQVRSLSGHLLVFFGLAVIVVRSIWIKNGPAMANAKV
jgi:hypothetical protein